MGITYIEGKVRGTGEKEKAVSLLIDSGVHYTLLPQDVWKDIDLKPKRNMEFILSDGTKIKREVSECYIELEMGEGHTPVVLGEKDDEAILGVVTLEILGLVFNPLKRTLSPMKALLI
ncbi:MAG: aspartyl protease family protein [Spirochaetes bacterium]|nr:aspartyl protease family protein [Spirochaetota bacterium]